MKRIKELLKDNIKVEYSKEKMMPCFVTIITSMLVHFALYSLVITGPDTLINSMYHQPDVWESMLMRFGDRKSVV